jgi:hypothetical protein
MIYKKFKLFLEGKRLKIEDLEEFRRKMIEDMKDLEEVRNTFDIKDINEVKQYIEKNILTQEFRNKIKEFYNIEIPPISYLRKGYGNREYHKIYKYDLVDTIITSKEKFNFEISIEIPKDKEFRDDNTSMQMSIWISGKSRKGKSKKDFFEMFNKKISTDSEFNRYTILGLIQAFGKAINEKI